MSSDSSDEPCTKCARRHANVKFVRDGVADFNLSDAGLGLAVVRDERAAFLEDASCGIARNGTLILEGDGAAVRQLANPFRVHGGGERRIRQGWNEDANQHFARAPIRRTPRLLRRWLGCLG